jgi:hypothetical protein
MQGRARGVSEKEALDEFENIPHNEVMDRLVMQHGKWMFRNYGNLVILTVTLSGSRLVDDFAALGHGELTNQKFAVLVLYPLSSRSAISQQSAWAWRPTYLPGCTLWLGAMAYCIASVMIVFCALVISFVACLLSDKVADGSDVVLGSWSAD